MSVGVCFIGGTRIPRPLDSTAEKKFRALATLADTSVVAFSRTWRPGRFQEHVRFYLLAQLPVPVLRYALLSTVGLALALWLALRRNTRILVGQSPYEGFIAAAAKRVCALLGRPTVCIVESHGDFERALFLQRTIRLPALHGRLMRRAASFALRHADILRAVSDTTRAQLESWAPGKPVVQFAAWSDLEVFLSAGERPEDRSRAHFVYAGVVIPLRDLETLVTAFAMVASAEPDATLWMVGRRPNSEYATALQARIASHGLAERVTFVDEVAQTRLAEMLARCTALVMPSLSEGFGRVAFEAMACATPVIASAVGGLSELIQDGVTGWLVPPKDACVLADRLRSVIAQREEARAVGAAAREAIRGRFAADAYIEGYRTLFARAGAILGASGAPR